MWDLVGNPEDRFSHNKAHLFKPICQKTKENSYKSNKLLFTILEYNVITRNFQGPNIEVFYNK